MQKASDKGYTAMNEFDAWHRADRTGEAAYVEAVERGVSSANIAHDMGAKAAAAIIRTYGDERYQAAIADVVEWLRRDGYLVASVSTPRMETDNLAIILCNQFDNPDQQNDDDTGWTPDATEGCDEVITAIASYFSSEITRRFGKDA